MGLKPSSMSPPRLTWGMPAPVQEEIEVVNSLNFRRTQLAMPLQSISKERAVGRYEFLDNVAVADCALEVEADDLNDLFETATRAVAEIMVDPETLPTTVERIVSLTADSLDLLLYDWLSELIYLKDAEQVVFTRVEAEVTREPVCRVTARLWGGRIDPERTGLRADAKAVTLHLFVLEPRGKGWYARVVIDI